MANEPATGHGPDGSTLPQSIRSTTESAVTPGPTHRRTKGIFSSRVRSPFASAGAVAVALAAVVVVLIAFLVPHILSSNDPSDPNLFGIAIDWKKIVQRQAASYRRRAVLDGIGRETGCSLPPKNDIRIEDVGSDASAVNNAAAADNHHHHLEEEAIGDITSQSLLLRDVVILVTGATSGIGRELVKWTYGQGATVIAMGRSSRKLTDLVEELTGMVTTTTAPPTAMTSDDGNVQEQQCKVVGACAADPTHVDGNVCRPSQRLFTVVADFADLESVARAADAMWEASAMSSSSTLDGQVQRLNGGNSSTAFPIHPWIEGATFPDHIDILVNNAGIHMGFETLWDMYPKSAQGYDLVFAVNYLSHFLLTEKLLGTFLAASRRPRVVQVTSSFHFAVDGSDLFPTTTVLNNNSNNVAAPIASIPGGSHGFYVYKSQRQYANSKLAQILHARYLANNNQKLQRTNHHDDDNNNNNKSDSNHHATYVSACPAWVGTSIIRFDKERIIARLFRAMAFPVNGYGLSSILRAMFAKEEEDDSNDNNDNVVDRQDNDQRSKRNSATAVGDYFINTGFFHAATSFDRFLMAYTSTPTVRDTGSMATTITPTIATPITRTWTYGWIPLRDCAVFLMSMFLLQWQRVWPVLDTTISSQASYDERLQEELYEWSRNAVQQWL